MCPLLVRVFPTDAHPWFRLGTCFMDSRFEAAESWPRHLRVDWDRVQRGRGVGVTTDHFSFAPGRPAPFFVVGVGGNRVRGISLPPISWLRRGAVDSAMANVRHLCPHCQYGSEPCT